MTLNNAKKMQLAHNLKEQIITRAKEKNLSITMLERKAGLPRGAASNILAGKSSNPSIQLLHSIAQVFECTVDELLLSTDFKLHRLAQEPEDLKLFVGLFNKTVDAIVKKIGSDTPEITLNQILSIIREAYAYSLTRKNKCIDEEFIGWLIDTKFKKHP